MVVIILHLFFEIYDGKILDLATHAIRKVGFVIRFCHKVLTIVPPPHRFSGCLRIPPGPRQNPFPQKKIRKRLGQTIVFAWTFLIPHQKMRQKDSFFALQNYKTEF